MKLVKLRNTDCNWLWVYLKNYEPLGLDKKEDMKDIKLVERILVALQYAEDK